MFIVFEGGDGTGKTTQVNLVKQFYKSIGEKVSATYEPGSTFVGNQIRSILLNPKNKNIHPQAELMLFFADRMQNMHEIIIPALKNNEIVLCDRFIYSSIVYQGIVKNLKSSYVSSLCHIFFQTKPDVVFILDVDPTISLKRIAKRSNRIKKSRFDTEKIKFHRDVRNGFRYLPSYMQNKTNFVLIDASGTEEETFKEIIEHLPFTETKIVK